MIPYPLQWCRRHSPADCHGSSPSGLFAESVEIRNDVRILDSVSEPSTEYRARCSHGVKGDEPFGEIELIADATIGIGKDVDIAAPGLALIVIHADVHSLAGLPVGNR